MPYMRSLKRFSRQSWEGFVAELDEVRDDALMEGVVAGCAVMAYADGWATEEERRRMHGLVRAFPLERFGAEDVAAYFDELSSRFADDPEAAEAEALAVVAQLKPRGRLAELLITTCCAIAAADGGFDAEERVAAIRICGVLGLAPEGFDLAEAT